MHLLVRSLVAMKQDYVFMGSSCTVVILVIHFDCIMLPTHTVAALHRYLEGCQLQDAFDQLHTNLQRQRVSKAEFCKAVLAASSMVIKCTLQVCLSLLCRKT